MTRLSSTFRNLFLLIVITILVSALVSATRKKTSVPEINIHYTLDYKGDSWEKNRTGLLWTLSYLGADLPRTSFDRSVRWIGSQTFHINFKGIGFSEKALRALGLICDSLKASGEYKKTRSVDLAHFITITLGSSWHYYEITGVPHTYAEFLSLHANPVFESMALTHSSVSYRHRLLKMQLSDSIQKSVFVAEEGNGDLRANTFIPEEYEVMDIMPNGQLRFMIYDKNGELVAAASNTFGEAGKPAKCIWCHEINIQPLFERTDTLKGFMSPREFAGRIARQNALVAAYRSRRYSDIDFTKLKDHAFQELKYISYMEPSILRLSQEWKIRPKKLALILKNKTSHTHHEFTFLGKLYTREDLKDLKPYKKFSTGILPYSIREEGADEPDYFKRKRP